MPDIKEITKLIESPDKEELFIIKKAYEFAEKVHEGHKRYSGEPHFIHLFETAKNLAELGMRGKTIAAGLLHDVIEDTAVTPNDLEEEFDKEMRFLVEGVTQLGKIKYRGMDRHNESLRKLFVAVSQDIRVLIIRLADRLHNIKTLQYMPEEKKERIAAETLEIYAPVAYRLGIRKLSKDLEDYSFPYVYPKEYEEITNILKEHKSQKMRSLEKFHKSLRKTLAEEKVNVIKTNYRIKGIYSLYLKYLKKDKDIEKIYDILAIRVVVPTVNDCYSALGIIHGTWRPLPKRVKDYIAFPKPNGYQSLHTTIFSGDGSIIELQIKTQEMYMESEYGIASHLSYKKKGSGWLSLGWIYNLTPFIQKKEDIKNTPDKILNRAEEEIPGWIREFVEYQSQTSEKTLVEKMRDDFFQQRIFIFTPKGDVIDLPIDATPIDFAYAIHSDIGNKIFGAKVNGKMVSLNKKLHNGDIVDIQTKNSSHPTEKWAQYAVTALAQKHIRAYLQKKREAR